MKKFNEEDEIIEKIINRINNTEFDTDYNSPYWVEGGCFGWYCYHMPEWQFKVYPTPTAYDTSYRLQAYSYKVNLTKNIDIDTNQYVKLVAKASEIMNRKTKEEKERQAAIVMAELKTFLG